MRFIQKIFPRGYAVLFGLLAVSLLMPFALCSCTELKTAAQSHKFVYEAVKRYNEDTEQMRFMTFYYRHPQSDKLIPSLQYWLNQGYFRREDQANVNTFVQFYAAAIRRSDKKVVLVQQLRRLRQDYSDADRAAIDLVIARVGKFTSPPATSAENFDRLWTEFFATGDEAPVRKIAGFLALTDDQNKLKVMTLATAQWSLASNAKQHPKVAEILQALYPKSHGVMKRRLQRILDDPQAVVDRMHGALHPGKGDAKTKAKNFEEFKRLVW